MKHNKILVDTIYLNSSGGLSILYEFIDFIESNNLLNNFFFLVDLRNKGNKRLLKKIDYKLLYNSYGVRKNFYTKHQEDYHSYLCFSNIPPLIKLNKPVYIYFHNAILINPIINNISLKDKFFNFFKSKFIASKNHIDYMWLVQTKGIASLISTYFRVSFSKIQIMPIFNEKPYLTKNKKEKNTFLYVSSFENHKNHDRLVKAFIKSAKMINKTIKLSLTISNAQFDLLKYRNKLPNNLSIVNYGILDEKKLGKIYSKSEYLIYPSLNESFGLPLVESINYDCKVIASELDYVHQIIKPSLTFNPYSIKDISNVINQATKKKDLKSSKIIVENKIDTFVRYLLRDV